MTLIACTGDYGKVKTALLAYKEKNGNMDVRYTFTVPSGEPLEIALGDTYAGQN